MSDAIKDCIRENDMKYLSKGKEIDPNNISQFTSSMKERIMQVCHEVETLLIEKNKSYGNSAADPVRVFSKSDPIEQINVRIDDKLSRIARGNEFDGDDTELDLIGYLLLKRAIKIKDNNENNETNNTSTKGL